VLTTVATRSTWPSRSVPREVSKLPTAHLRGQLVVGEGNAPAPQGRPLPRPHIPSEPSSVSAPAMSSRNGAEMISGPMISCQEERHLVKA